MPTWTSVNDEPVPFDCDVIICHKGLVRVEVAKDWKKGLRVSLAHAWGLSFSGTGQVIQRVYWLEKPSFFRWPNRELIPYAEITHWMLFEGLPEPPAGEQVDEALRQQKEETWKSQRTQW